MSSDFDLQSLMQRLLINDIQAAIDSSDTSKILICDEKGLSILNANLTFAQVIDLGIRSNLDDIKVRSWKLVQS